MYTRLFAFTPSPESNTRICHQRSLLTPNRVPLHFHISVSVYPLFYLYLVSFSLFFSFLFEGISNAKDVDEVLEEAFTMKELDHPNVIPIYGVCMEGNDPPLMCLEFMHNGDLRTYMKRSRGLNPNLPRVPDVSQHAMFAFSIEMVLKSYSPPAIPCVLIKWSHVAQCLNVCFTIVDLTRFECTVLHAAFMCTGTLAALVYGQPGHQAYVTMVVRRALRPSRRL